MGKKIGRLRNGKGVLTLALLCWVVAGTNVLYSQTSTGTIWGTITDPSGSRLSEARVTIRNTRTNTERSTLSNELGNYATPLLQPAEYEVIVELAGFSTSVRSGIDLQVDERARVDVELQTGEVRFFVTVVADAPMTEAGSSTLGATVNEHKVIELPLNGRNFFQLTHLVPGAAPAADGSQANPQGGAVVVNGMRDQSNNFLLDGVDNNDQTINQVVVPPPVDAIREFKVQSGVYPGEFGSRAGAQLNVVSKSGTNQFHLTLYEFHRNAVFDAKNFFDPPNRKIPKFIRNQFGVSAGGPIIRDRTFFFANFEGLRERKAITRLATVPPAEFVQGDFSSLPFPIVHPLTREPLPGNLIPAPFMHPIGSEVARFFPPPNTNQPGGNLLSQPVQKDEVDQFLIRVDHEIGLQDSFFARYAFFDSDRFSPFDAFLGETNIPGFGNFRFGRGQNLALGGIHTFEANLLNDLVSPITGSRAVPSRRISETTFPPSWESAVFPPIPLMSDFRTLKWWDSTRWQNR